HEFNRLGGDALTGGYEPPLRAGPRFCCRQLKAVTGPPLISGQHCGTLGTQLPDERTHSRHCVILPGHIGSAKNVDLSLHSICKRNVPWGAYHECIGGSSYSDIEEPASLITLGILNGRGQF